MKTERKPLAMLVASMFIFGTVGIFRKAIPLPSAVIAMLRGGVGALFLLGVMLIGRKKLSSRAIRENLLPLFLSGTAMGFNWILLFEAYNYTTVATATLCYYMAPIFTILASPFLLNEKLTGRRLVCVAVALVGMVLVSGVIGGGGIGENGLKGVALGLGAAVLYASVILMNKRMKPMPAYDRTVIQLAAAAVVLLLYTAVSGQLRGLTVDGTGLVMLLIICVVHTGVAYALYFGSMEHLPAQVLAIFSYIDPVVAVLLSALLLDEKLTLAAGIGAMLVIGSAMLCELPEKEPEKK